MDTVDPSPAAISRRTAWWMLGLGAALLGASWWLSLEENVHADAFWRSIEATRDRTQPLGQLWSVLSDLGHGYTLTVLIGTLTVVLGSRRVLQDALVMAFSAAVVTRLLKILVNRARPFDPDFLSWPSGHASASLAIALVFLRAPRVFAVALPLALLAGVARVMHHRHWPSDVLGGYAVALACAAFGLRLRTFLPAALVGVPVRRALSAALLLVLLLDLALTPWKHASPGYLQLLATPLVVVAAAFGLGLVQGGRPA